MHANCLQNRAGPEAGAALARHPVLERVDFTGGTATGLQIQRAMAEAGRVRAYCAELGGNAPILVFKDTRCLQEAVDGVAFAAFVASGQTCVSGKRILVQSEVFDDFRDRLVAKAEQLRLGDPLSAETDLGPVISTAAQLSKHLMRDCKCPKDSSPHPPPPSPLPPRRGPPVPHVPTPPPFSLRRSRNKSRQAMSRHVPVRFPC